MDELLAEFIAETGERLADVDAGLACLAGSVVGSDPYRAIFINLHSIKGACGFFGFDQLEALTHAGEGMLEIIRKGDGHERAKALNGLRVAVAHMRAALALIESDGVMPPGGLLARPSVEPAMRRVAEAWAPLGTLVGKLAERLGKQIALRLQGGDIRVAAEIVQGLRQPIVQMAQNACDHGIESLLERQAAGKTAVGHLAIKASRIADDLVISFADDGRGLAIEAIAERASHLGLMPVGSTASAARGAVADAAVAQMIFEPGLSTSNEISTLSGRGIGMDVVRSGVEDLGGEIAVRSIAGRGTEFIIRIPLCGRSSGGWEHRSAVPATTTGGKDLP